MTPLCRICNHEHGVADPHVFATIEAVAVPDKGVVYVAKPAPRKRRKKEDADAKLLKLRAQRAASMRRYRAKLKAKQNGHG